VAVNTVAIMESTDLMCSQKPSHCNLPWAKWICTYCIYVWFITTVPCNSAY